MSEWVETTLGEVLTIDITTVDVIPSETYEIVGVLNRGRGLLHRDSIRGTQTAYKTLNRVSPNQVVYSRLKAFEGAITVVPSNTPVAFASQEFPTFSCEPNLLPDFFRLITTTPALWSALRALSTGMGGRRERVKPAAFLTIPVYLPPLPVQKRIVEVIGAIDDAIGGLDDAARAGLATRSALLTDLLGTDHDTATLGEMGQFIRGRRFTKNDYVQDGLGCIHYGQIYTDYGATAKQTVTHVPEDLRSALRLAHPGDLVIAATSENVDDIGKAVAWLGNDDVAVHDDCYIFRHSLDPVYAAYFFASSMFQSQKAQYARGTKVYRVSAADFAKVNAPVLSVHEQKAVADVGTSLDVSLAAARAEADRLRGVRSALLAALLNREIEIANAKGTAA